MTAISDEDLKSLASKLDGLDSLLSTETGLPVYIAESPETCVALGLIGNPEATALPLLLPIVVYHGDGVWSAARDFGTDVFMDSSSLSIPDVGLWSPLPGAGGETTVRQGPETAAPHLGRV